ncbi:MAG TPA: prepilin-type N-terminal cleavage/methylation domain-containing protein [Candidatus Limnocylindria bacterium]|nr:prepilin-type N-terminal cleavage/methylation domain-containing protein [Candidatus Limnocylindria bacterium]
MTHHNQKGFSLVELVVAIGITGLLVVGITSLFITIETTQRKTRLLEIATRAGEKKIEELRNNHYNSLEADSVITFTDELPDTLPTPREATVAVSEPTDGIKRVDLNITYKDGRINKEVELSSLIGVIGIGQ